MNKPQSPSLTPDQRTAPSSEAPRVTPLVAVIGNPTAGKSTVFNQLTGMSQKVGNYPGVTVEKTELHSFLELASSSSFDAVRFIPEINAGFFRFALISIPKLLKYNDMWRCCQTNSNPSLVGQ